MIMKIILNEKRFAEESIKSGETDRKPSKTLHAIAKYYYSLGMLEDQVIYNLECFMKQNYPNFVRSKWQDKIEKVASQELRNKKPLNNIEQINITESELKTIKNLESIGIEKLAFVLLVHAKVFNELNGSTSNWVNSKSQDIFSDCNVPISVEKQNSMIFRLKNLGLISLSHKVDSESIRVNFIDNESKCTIQITDFRKFIYEYLKWRGEKIVRCAECKVSIRKNNHHRTKYCNKCAKKVNRNKTRERKNSTKSLKIKTL